ncbi:hypothetical protein GCM10023185_14750 [Hymenobacter saemangeumensis]|uniref:Integrase catalytic domain-containing protein n=1 Tax=Hymenobacter saemangeumensis TaxID=1084522 RepID=A0ABP8I8Y6_9BACT
MQLINSIIYVPFDSLVSLGVPEGTIKYGIAAHRAGKAQSWANMPDPADKRRVLVAYDSIPPATRAKLPAKSALLQQLADKTREATSAADALAVRMVLPAVPKADLAALRGFRIERELTDKSTGEVLTKELSGLPEDKIKAYGMACRWLALLSDEKWKKKAERVKLSPAFAAMPAFIAACVDLFTEDGVKLPTNYSKLQAKLREYKEQGAACLVSKSYGNTNTLKVGHDELEYLIKLYSDARKPSFELVTAWYNEAAVRRRELGLNPWPEITSGTTKKRLLAPDVQPNWYLPRHGFAAWKAKYEYTMLCYKPTQRDVQWVIDGTKVNKRYRTAKGTSAKLKVLVVMDVATDYFLGWAFAETEDSREVAKAVRMAHRRAGGVKPLQFLYDGDSANLSFFKGVGGLHYKAMPHNGQSKTIEGAFGRLQQQIMRADKNFTGQNITAKEINSRENLDDFKEKDLPTLAECIAQAEFELHVWNNYKGSKGDRLSPKELYEASQNGDTDFMTPEDEMEAFWVWNDRPITYRKDGLRFKKQGVETVFEVVNEVATDFPGVTQRVPDMDFHSAFVGQEFWVKYDPENPAGGIGLFVGADKRFIGFAHPKQAMPRAQADYKAGDRDAIQVRLVAKKEQAGRIVNRQADIADRFDAEELLKFGQNRWWGKDVETAAEEDFMKEQDVAKAPRRLPARAASPATVASPASSSANHASKSDYLKRISFNED